MFALPIISGMNGFIPSLIFFVIASTFMVTTAFFIQRAMHIYPDCQNFLSLTKKILGPLGEGIVFLSFISLFFSLIIAYLVKGGALVQTGIERLISTPSHTGIFLLAAATCFFIVRGIRVIDSLNKVFMVGLAATFLYLTFLGNESRNFSFIQQKDWSYSIPTFSFLVISFGFHNLLPSLNSYLGKNPRKVKKAIFIGALLPFTVYLIWLTHFLSLVPYEGPVSITAGYHSGQIASEVLGQILQDSRFVIMLEGFAFFAIITSLLAQALSLQDFIQDAFSRINLKSRRSVVSLLIFIPSLAIALSNPHIFFQLLEIGGGVLAVILFGVIPGFMILKIETFKNKNRWFFAAIAVLTLSTIVIGGEIWKIANG